MVSSLSGSVESPCLGNVATSSTSQETPMGQSWENPKPLDRTNHRPPIHTPPPQSAGAGGFLARLPQWPQPSLGHYFLVSPASGLKYHWGSMSSQTEAPGPGIQGDRLRRSRLPSNFPRISLHWGLESRANLLGFFPPWTIPQRMAALVFGGRTGRGPTSGP